MAAVKVKVWQGADTLGRAGSGQIGNILGARAAPSQVFSYLLRLRFVSGICLFLQPILPYSVREAGLVKIGQLWKKQETKKEGVGGGLADVLTSYHNN